MIYKSITLTFLSAHLQIRQQLHIKIRQKKTCQKAGIQESQGDIENVKADLHYGENRSKLVRFKEQKINFAIFKKTSENVSNRTACIRHQCRKAPVLSCHRFLINTGVEQLNYI